MVTSTAAFNVRLGVKDEATVRRALENLGGDGEKALRRLDRSARDAAAGGTLSKRAFDGLTASTRVLEGPLGGVAGRMTSVAAALRIGNPLLIAAGTAAAATAVAIKKSLTAYEEFERRQLRVNALLQATRQSSGQTAESLEALAQGVARNTLASIEGARDAAGALLTFRSVSGEAFGRTLRLAQDLAEVFGQDLKSATLQLGKALEDPERNLSQLNRSGISFNQTQIDTIKRMKETGDEAGALNEILKTIEAQVGGAGAAAAGGLAGSWDSFTEAMTRAFERMGEITGLAPKLAAALKGVTGALDEFSENSIESRLNAARDRLSAARNNPRFRASREPGALRDFNALLVEQGSGARAREDAEVLADLAAKARAEEARSARDREESEKATLSLNKERLKELHAQVALIGKLKEEDLKRADALKKFIAEAEREAELAILSKDARAEQTAILRAQDVAGRALTVQERERLNIATRATRAAEAKAEAEREAAAAAKREAERVTGELTDLGAGFIDSFLDSGKVEDFFTNLVSFARRSFAQLAADALLRPIILPIVTRAVGGAPVGAAAAGGPGGGPGGVSGFGSFLNADTVSGFSNFFGFGGAGSAGVSGAAVSGGLPSSGAAGVGSGVGGAPGAAAGAGGLAGAGGFAAGAAGFGIGFAGGSIVGGFVAGDSPARQKNAQTGALIGSTVGLAFGPIGAVVGGVLGGLVGGFLGPGKSVGPTAEATVGVRSGRASILATGADNGASSSDAQQLGSAVTNLTQAIVQVGGGRLGAGSIGIRAQPGGGGFAVTAPGGGETLAEFGDDAGAAVVDAVRRLVAGGTVAGLDQLVDAAVRRSLEIRRDPDEVVADLRLAQTVADLRDSVSDTVRALRDLNAEFEDVSFRARELRLPLGDLTRQFQNTQADTADRFFGGILDPLRAARAGLSAAGQSPGERFAAARAEAERLLSLAEGGNVNALRGAGGAVSQAVALGEGVFGAAGPELAGLRESFGGRLDRLIEDVAGERDALGRDFGLIFQDSIERQTATLGDEIRNLRAALERGLEIIAEAQKPVAAAVQEVKAAVRETETERDRLIRRDAERR